jgi:hypothetical protein
VIAWQADALLIVLAAAGGSTVLFATGDVGAALWLVSGMTAVILWAWQRIRHLG